MSEEKKQNGWNEYSKYVVNALREHKDEMDKILKTVTDIDARLIRMEESIKEVDEIKKDVKSLNFFKAVAITVWTLVQLGFTLFIAWMFK